MQRIQAQRTQYNEFVESRLKNQVLMSWVAIPMHPNDTKTKIDQLYLIKIVFNTIRGDQFQYISVEIDYKYSSYSYSVFLLIFRSPFLSVFFLFYTILLFHLYPPRVDQIDDVDSCPISTFLKSLGSSCKAERYCLGITFSLMRPESQLQSI